MGRRSLAKRAYLTALELDGDNAAARVNLGWYLYLDGDLAAAADNFRASMAVEPSGAAHFNLALVLLAQGRGKTAREQYALGLERYGAEEARRIGVVADLRALLAEGGDFAKTGQEIDA